MTKVRKFDAQTHERSLDADYEASGEPGGGVVLLEPLLEVRVVFKQVELKVSLSLPMMTIK